MRNYDFSKFTNGPASCSQKLHLKASKTRPGAYTVSGDDRTNGARHLICHTPDLRAAKDAREEIRRIITAAKLMVQP